MIIEITNKDEDLSNLIEQIERIPFVEYAEPNIIHHTGQTIPNEYNNLALLQANQWALDIVGLPSAWDQSTGSSNILISIVDTGIAMPARIPGTIYRWYNPANGDHFYTTDPSGELTTTKTIAIDFILLAGLPTI